MVKKYYFIDDDIWYHGERQPPRKVYCYNIRFTGNVAEFYDEDGNSYHLPKERIFKESIEPSND